MPKFKRGDRIIRVGGNMPHMKVGTKVVAGEISENGRYVIVGTSMFNTSFFKLILKCQRQ